MTKNSIITLIAIIAISFAITSCNQTNNGEKEEKKEKKETKMKKDKKDCKKVAVLVTEGFHDGEAYMPIGYLTNRGVKVCVIGPEVGEVKAYNSDFTVKIQKSISDVSVDYFDALILPGGKAPATLREIEEVTNFTAEFYKTGKTVAAICHGPQVLISAGVMDGKTSTAFPDVKSELEEVGATFIDEELVIDGNIITSRVPKDLHAFSQAIYNAIK